MTEPSARATARPERLEIDWMPGARFRASSATRARLLGPGTSVAILGAFNRLASPCGKPCREPASGASPQGTTLYMAGRRGFLGTAAPSFGIIAPSVGAPPRRMPGRRPEAGSEKHHTERASVD